MARLDELKRHLKRGKVYRREDLAKWSKSVDRHLEAFLQSGTLQKLSQGLYYYPKESLFGKTPPEETALIRSFLKDDRFLLTSPNAYNSLGVGTTQLYNKRIVYNHKRHGEYKLGSRNFQFQIKPHFPEKATEEFLLVDLVNNLNNLAEDQNEVMKKVSAKVRQMNKRKFENALAAYGTVRTKKMLRSLLQPLVH